MSALARCVWTSDLARAAVAALLATPDGPTAADYLRAALLEAKEKENEHGIGTSIMQALASNGINAADVAGIMFETYPYDEGSQFYEIGEIYFRSGLLREVNIFEEASLHLCSRYGVVAEDAGFYFIPSTGNGDLFYANASLEMQAAIRAATGAKTPEQYATTQLALQVCSQTPEGVRVVVFPPSPRRQGTYSTAYSADGTGSHAEYSDEVNHWLNRISALRFGQFPGATINCVTGQARLGEHSPAEAANWAA